MCGSPRFLGIPLRACPALRPRRGRRGLVPGHDDVAFHHTTRCRPSRETLYRGSITRPTRSLSTLRSMGRPMTTQDSVPAADPLCRVGLSTHRVPMKGFRPLGLPPFPGFAWRKPCQGAESTRCRLITISTAFLRRPGRMWRTKLGDDWTYPASSGLDYLDSSPIVVNDTRVYVGSRDGRLYSVRTSSGCFGSASDGSVAWSTLLTEPPPV